MIQHLRRFFVLTLGVLAVLMTAVGVASYWIATMVWLTSQSDWQLLNFSCSEGQTTLTIRLRPQSDDTRIGSEFSPIVTGFAFRDDILLNPTYYAGDNSPSEWTRVRQILANFPAWFPPLVLWLYPIWTFVRGPLLRYRRLKRNECPKCGYSLTGNVTGVCPECGTRIQPP